MSELLRQPEIDAILGGKSDSAQANDGSRVVPYNFARPSRIPQERRKVLDAMHSHFAASLQTMLEARLRMGIEIAVVSIESVSYNEFKMVLLAPCASFLFRLGGRSNAEGLIDFGSEFAFHLVDRLLGGPGGGAGIDRSLTNLEQEIVRAVADRSLVLLKEAWKEQIQISPEIIRFESDPEMLEMAKPDEPVLIVNLESRTAGRSSFLTLCTPVSVVDSIFADRSSPTPSGGRRSHAAGGALHTIHSSGIQHAGLEVSARLPVFYLKTRAITALQVGQTIETPFSTETPAELEINGRPWFSGSIGQAKQRIGFKVADTTPPIRTERPGLTKEGKVNG